MKYLVNDTDLTAIADAIRGRRGTTDEILFEELANEITTNLLKKSKFVGLVNRSVTEINDEDGFCSTIGSYAFYSFTKLVTANFPNVTRVESYAFQKCTGLTMVDMPKLTSLQAYAFGGCTKLSSISLPRCKSIAANAFNGCSALNEIYLLGSTVPTLSAVSAFNGTPFASGGDGGVIYVPYGLEASYYSATNWSSIITNNTNNRVIYY